MASLKYRVAHLDAVRLPHSLGRGRLLAQYLEEARGGEAVVHLVRVRVRVRVEAARP